MGDRVATSVVNPDGSPGGATLDPQEWALQDAALKRLVGHQGFQPRYPGALLRRVEVRRGQDVFLMRLCLQFEVPGQGTVSFWAQWGRRWMVDLSRGWIIVPVES